jgi:hypothetical protein
VRQLPLLQLGLGNAVRIPAEHGLLDQRRFAEHAVGYARNVVRVPVDVDPLDAAPLTCAGVTTYKAVKVSGARSSSVVAAFGAGGLGHLAIQYARITGAAVIAVDINEARLETVRELGAEHVVHAGEEDVVAAIQRLGGADVAIATAVSPAAFEQALGSLARGGTLVCVGLPANNEIRVPVFETVLGGLTIHGSIVGTHRDLEEVFELHRRGQTRVLRTERPLDDVNEAIEQVLDGSAPQPRMVFDMQGAREWRPRRRRGGRRLTGARSARFHGSGRVVCAVCGGVSEVETAGVPIREEATMRTTVEKPDTSYRTMDWLAGLAEDAAVIVMLFSGFVIAAAILAAAIAL